MQSHKNKALTKWSKIPVLSFFKKNATHHICTVNIKSIIFNETPLLIRIMLLIWLLSDYFPHRSPDNIKLIVLDSIKHISTPAKIYILKCTDYIYRFTLLKWQTYLSWSDKYWLSISLDLRSTGLREASWCLVGERDLLIWWISSKLLEMFIEAHMCLTMFFLITV